jgi:hypothetical protein
MNQPTKNNKHEVPLHEHVILLSDCQRHRLNKSCAAVSNRLHLEDMAARFSTSWWYDHIQIQWVAKGLTCKIEEALVLLKTKSLRTSRISHSKVQTRKRI